MHGVGAVSKRIPPEIKRAKRIALFWSRVTKGNPDECWLWTGCTNRYGYGCTELFGKQMNASRAAWILTHGDAGALVVCHKCDVPACCNPTHLWLGTPGDNVRDCRDKGRHRTATGKDHPRLNAKLSPEMVIEARRLHFVEGMSQSEIGRRWKIHSSVISRAVRGERWSHV